MERETITITTPLDKRVIVIKSYITGREQRALTNVFLQNMSDFNVDQSGKDVNVKKVNPSLVEEADNLAWKTVVVSIDGRKDGEEVNGKMFSIVNEILDMKLQDYNFVADKVKEVTADKHFLDEKKN